MKDGELVGATLVAGIAIYKGVSWALNELDARDNVLDDSFKNASPAEQYINKRKAECNRILNNSRLKEELLEKAKREEELGHT